MELKDKIKQLPSSPGVYLMKDAQGGILYVGKAKNLRRRVQSYFQNVDTHSPKVAKLVKHLRDFDYILTDTEFEAFLLECKLIREIKPLYNKKMKSPLSYTYIAIDKAASYPKIALSNNPTRAEDRLLFGPYTSKSTVERALQGLKEHLKIVCSNPTKKKNTCLNYSLGLCLGMCLGETRVQQYSAAMAKLIALLSGSDLEILHELEQKMTAASGNYDFEAAAKYRDYVSAIEYILHKGKMIGFTEENKKIAVFERLDDSTIKLFLIKGNKVLFSEKYSLEGPHSEHLTGFVKDKIQSTFNDPVLNSARAVTSEDLDEAQIIYSYLKNNACSYMIIPEDDLGLRCAEQFCSRLLHLIH